MYITYNTYIYNFIITKTNKYIITTNSPDCEYNLN